MRLYTVCADLLPAVRLFSILSILLLLIFSLPGIAAAQIGSTKASMDKSEVLVTNVFADTDLRQALTDISAQIGVTIIADNTVQGTITAEIKDVPFEKALKMMLQSGGYAYAKLDDYYLVGMPDPSNPNYSLFCETTVLKLKYTSPQAMIAMLGVPYGKYLSANTITPANSPPRTAIPRQETARLSTPSNPMPGDQDYRLIITAPAYMQRRIQADIAQLDQPRLQVMLEASIVEVSQEALRAIGIDWATRHFRQDLTSGGPNLIYTAFGQAEMAQLTALIETGTARLRANPRVATQDGLTAEIEVGKENYFQIVTGNLNYATADLEKIVSGILLRITPRVLPEEDQVDVQVEPQVRDVTGRGENDLPEITFRRAYTTLRVPNGRSIIIGGLVNEFEVKNIRKVPLLGDIPILGQFFQRRETRLTRNEVVIIITPYIIRDIQPLNEPVSPAPSPLDGQLSPSLRDAMKGLPGK